MTATTSLSEALAAVEQRCQDARSAVRTGTVPLETIREITDACEQVTRTAHAAAAALHPDYEAHVARQVGRHLAQARVDRGWSVEDVVDRMGGVVDAATVTGYETGTVACGVARLIQLCQVLGASPLWVIARAVDPAP